MAGSSSRGGGYTAHLAIPSIKNTLLCDRTGFHAGKFELLDFLRRGFRILPHRTSAITTSPRHPNFHPLLITILICIIIANSFIIIAMSLHLPFYILERVGAAFPDTCVFCDLPRALAAAAISVLACTPPS